MTNHEVQSALTSCRIAAHGWRGECIAQTPLHAWLAAGGRPDEIGSPTDVLVRNGSRSRCYRIERLDTSTQLARPMFFKVYRVRPGVQAWFKRRIGWHRPSWAWRAGWMIHNLGVDVARPWGYLVPQPWHKNRCSYFWTDWIDDTRHARDLANDPASREIVIDDEWFARQVGTMLARLHGASVFHRDMNWGNLLVDASNQRVWLIDLDSVHRVTAKPRSAACRDLARFLMEAMEYGTSRAWRAHVLDTYAEHRTIERQPLDADVHSMIDMFYQRRRKKQARTAAE